MIQQILFFLLSNLIISCTTISSMELIVPTDKLSTQQLLSGILNATDRIDTYPWEKFKTRCTIKAVCTNWNEMIGSDQKIQASLGIHDIHYQAMKYDDPHRIIELDLEHHTTLEPDNNGFVPMHYAIACGNCKVIKALKIGHGNYIESPEKYISDKNRINNTAIRILEALNPTQFNPIVYDQLLFLFNTTINEKQRLPTFNVVMTLLSNPKEPIAPYDFIKKIKKFIYPLTKEAQQMKDLFLYSIKRTVETVFFVNFATQQTLHDEFIDFFIKHDGNLHSWNVSQTRLFHCLCQKDQFYKVLQRFLTLGKNNVNIEINSGETGLHFAAVGGQINNVSLLLQHGADVNKKNNSDSVIEDIDFGGFTPLHFASGAGQLEVIKLLLKYNADTTLLTTAGKTALDLAIEKNRNRIIELLSNKS